METITAFILIFVYFIPTIVALKRVNGVVVFLINLLFGWTILGWFIALIMSVSGKTHEDVKREKAMYEYFSKKK